MPKRIRLRAAAVTDLDVAESHYLLHAGASTAVQFMDAVEEAVAHVAERPDSGSLRYAQDLQLDGLRHWRVRRFPYLVFYVDDRNHITIWRVLHGRRDIPAELRADFSADA